MEQKLAVAILLLLFRVDHALIFTFYSDIFTLSIYLKITMSISCWQFENDAVKIKTAAGSLHVLLIFHC